MADYTKYKRLELPKSNEKYDVAVANKNNQVIDSELNKLGLKNQSQDNDIMELREILLELSTKLNILADSDDETLDQLSEIVSYIKKNKSLIDGITTNKLNVSDIIHTMDLLQSNITSGKVVDALLIKQVFQSVSDGKSLIASAITDKGIETDAMETFNNMAQNIKNISVKNGSGNLTSIVVSAPTKDTYDVGETLDLSGVIVTANYERTEDVTRSAIFNPVDGQTFTQAGTVTVAVSYTDGSVTKTAETSVIVKPPLEIVSWADGTDAQIEAMLDAHYTGKINIHDYWHVGDERIVHLLSMEADDIFESHVGQDVIMVLMNEGGKELAEPINGITECAFIVGQKDCLVEEGYINNTTTNAGGWDYCDRRIWCNRDYRMSIPRKFVKIFKEHKNVTAGGGSGASKKESVDYFALPTEKEVMGSCTYTSSTAEENNIQFTFYQTAENKLKKLGNNGAITAWWNRSPIDVDNNNASFSCSSVRLNGNSFGVGASKLYGISPFGCI